MREFFAYRIIERYNQFNALMFSGKLFQQFLVDGYTMIEAERIGYLKLNQKALRADKYINVSAYAENGNQDSTKCGKRIVLPSTYVGGERYMREKYMDAMAVRQILDIQNYSLHSLAILNGRRLQDISKNDDYNHKTELTFCPESSR